MRIYCNFFLLIGIRKMQLKLKKIKEAKVNKKINDVNNKKKRW